MRKIFFILAFTLMGILVFASNSNAFEEENIENSYQLSDFKDLENIGRTTFLIYNDLNPNCDFVFEYVSSCGTVNYECGTFNTLYYFSDIVITWNIYDMADCGGTGVDAEDLLITF